MVDLLDYLRMFIAFYLINIYIYTDHESSQGL